MTTHRPVPLYALAAIGCPHGPEPEQTTDAWDHWMTLGHQMTADGPICLSLPVGEQGCETCTDEHCTTVPWADCPERGRIRPRRDFVLAAGVEHQPIPGWIGTSECFDRECDDYFDQDDNERPDRFDVDACSHMRPAMTCSCRRVTEDEYDTEPCSLALATTTR